MTLVPRTHRRLKEQISHGGFIGVLLAHKDLSTGGYLESKGNTGKEVGM